MSTRTETIAENGAGRHADGTVRFERTMPGSPQRLWTFLTDNHHIHDWFDGGEHTYSMEPRLGGKVSFASGSIQGQVTRWERPHALSYSWTVLGPDGQALGPETIVAFRLEAHGDETRLILEHGPIGTGLEAFTLSGWHTYLDRIAAMLRGQDPGDAMEAMQRHRDAYLVDYPAAFAHP